MARTNVEKAVDRLLVLYLLHDAFSRKGVRFIPETKLQKLVFLSEWSMIGKRNKGLNFRFIKFMHGPFSQELETDARKLVQVGLVNDRGLEPTKQTTVILDDFRDVIEKNRSFMSYIEKTNDEFAEMPLDELLSVIYAMSWGSSKTVADLPLRTPMLYPMKTQSAESEFDLTGEEAEDLLMNFDPRSVSALLQATEQMRTGKMRPDERTLVGISK